MIHLHRTWAVLAAWVTLVNAVQRARLFRSEVPETPVKVSQSTHSVDVVQSDWNPDKPTIDNQATFLSSSSHQDQLPRNAFDRNTVLIGNQGGIHSLISMGQEDRMVVNRSGQSSQYTRPSMDHRELPAPAAWRSPNHRKGPHADADNYAGRRRTSIIIQSSGSVRAAATTGLDASLVQDLQVPATVAPTAAVAPALAATAAPVPVVAAVTVAPALAATVAPVAVVAPAAADPAAVPAATVTAAPAEGGGSMGSLFIFLALFAVVAAGVALAMRLRNQNRPGGRLGGMQDTSGGVDSQFWKSAKTRQSYRSTAISKSAASKGNMSTSDDDAGSSAQKGSGAAAQEAPMKKTGGISSASDDSKRPTGDTGSSKGVDSASTKSAYRDRKGARQASAEKGSRAASNG